jgi:hypothetical protein
MKRFYVFCVASILLSAFVACNQPSIIGSDILPLEDNINIFFTDTLSLRATTIQEDSTKVYDANPALQPARYLTGRVEDPIFGTYGADIYTQVELLATNPDFSDVELDSIVLTLAYDTDGNYGDFNNSYNLKIFEVLEDMNPNQDYYSNQDFMIDATPIGELDFTPSPSDSVLVDTILVKPHIRIPLDNAIGERFLNVTDTTVYQSDDFFTNFFKGIKLVGNQAGNQSILAFDLLDELTKLELHYTVGDTIQQVFTFRVKSGSTKVMNFFHDYQGVNAPVMDFFDNPIKGDSLAFLQSMEGLNVKVEMPNIDDWSNVIVNKAELIVRVAEDANSTLYPIPRQLILLQNSNLSDARVLIRDVSVSLQRTSSFSGLFGGGSEVNSDSGEDITEYRMNISGFLQDVIDGVQEDGTLYITTYPKPDQPSRLIIGGPGHSKYNMEIQLTYTKLN